MIIWNNDEGHRHMPGCSYPNSYLEDEPMTKDTGRFLVHKFLDPS